MLNALLLKVFQRDLEGFEVGVQVGKEGNHVGVTEVSLAAQGGVFSGPHGLPATRLPEVA